MTNRLALAVLVLGAVLLVTSSVAVSTVSLERPVTIEVTDSGPVEFDALDPTVSENESNVDLIRVTSQVETPLHVTVNEADGGTSTINALSGDDDIDPGESASITGTPSCVADESNIPIDIIVSGDGMTIERTETVTVTCTESHNQ